MSEIEKYKGEYTVLSYLVTCAERAREIMRRATVNESMFSSDENRAAFIALMAEPATDDALLLGVAAKALPALSGDPAIPAPLCTRSLHPPRTKPYAMFHKVSLAHVIPSFRAFSFQRQKPSRH